MRRAFYLMTAAATIFVSSSLLAEEVTVKDTAGFTRAQSEVDGQGKIEFNVVDMAGTPSDGAEATLTNTATGEERKGRTVAGILLFDGVAPGTWVIASTAPGLTFTSVTISSSTLVAGGAVAGGSALGGGAAVAGGGTLAGIGSGTLLTVAAVGGATAIAVSNNNNAGDDLSPAS